MQMRQFVLLVIQISLLCDNLSPSMVVWTYSKREKRIQRFGIIIMMDQKDLIWTGGQLLRLTTMILTERRNLLFVASLALFGMALINIG